MDSDGIKDSAELVAASQLEQIAAGNKTAENELVSKYWRGLYYVLHRRSNNPDLAADLAQDTFIIVLNKARKGEIENPSAISSFIRQTGINLLISHYRKEKGRATDTNAEIEFLIPDKSPELYRNLHSEKLLDIVRQLVDELKMDRDKQILKDYFVYEKDKNEICDSLELTPEYFDKVLFRARGRLKQLIQHRFKLDPSELLNVDVFLYVLVFTLIVSSNDVGLSQGKLNSSIPQVREIDTSSQFNFYIDTICLFDLGRIKQPQILTS